VVDIQEVVKLFPIRASKAKIILNPTRGLGAALRECNSTINILHCVKSERWVVLSPAEARPRLFK
jgi:hypothetical protein